MQCTVQQPQSDLSVCADQGDHHDCTVCGVQCDSTDEVDYSVAYAVSRQTPSPLCEGMNQATAQLQSVMCVACCAGR